MRPAGPGTGGAAFRSRAPEGPGGAGGCLFPGAGQERQQEEAGEGGTEGSGPLQSGAGRPGNSRNSRPAGAQTALSDCGSSDVRRQKIRLFPAASSGLISSLESFSTGFVCSLCRHLPFSAHENPPMKDSFSVSLSLIGEQGIFCLSRGEGFSRSEGCQILFFIGASGSPDAHRESSSSCR